MKSKTIDSHGSADVVCGQDKAAARPWKVSPPLGEGAFQIQSEGLNAFGNWIVAEVPNRTPQDEANAALIVKAVNEHAALTAQIEALEQFIRRHCSSLCQCASLKEGFCEVHKAYHLATRGQKVEGGK